MTIEDQVRDAQHRQADRAVPVERIRAGLATRISRARRRRRVGLAAGAGLVAAAVAAVIAVPSLMTPLTGPPAAPPTGTPAYPFPKDPPLGYRVGWVPDGFTEDSREWRDVSFASNGPVGSELIRIWRKPDGGRLELSVSLSTPRPNDIIGGRGEPVDIGGGSGRYGPTADGAGVGVSWAPGDHELLRLSGYDAGVTRADLLRMARSAVPAADPFVVPLRLRTAPDGFTLTGMRVEGTASDWRVSLTLAAAGFSRHVGYLSIWYGRDVLARPGGTPLTIAGRPARLLEGSAQTPPVPADQLVVDLGDRLMLTLTTNLAVATPEVLVGLAENTVVTGAGVEWLGTR